ncbi:MAG: asparagine synthase (glutamine-hydrolyzing) [Candidatus Wallbacteria bacterium]
MCGIIGFSIRLNNKISNQTFKKMADTINYRGPNDEGYFLLENDNFQFGLAQKRLSIIDLSPLGHQPMHFENLSIVFNGEIYNFNEIKQELEKLGYNFISKSDTEVILKAFHKWGINCISKFNGMFAIAIFDRITEELYLIRDRMGVKPLYYYYNGFDIVFASELKPIMAYPYFQKELNFEALNSYLFHGYISAPDTIFKNVYKLKPGHYLKWKKGKIELINYWSLIEKFNNSIMLYNLSEKEHLKNLDALITSSVKYRMISDVPIGCFLSGGFDSSLIAAMMQKLSNVPINTFTIGFNENKYNEAKHAKVVAQHIGTCHHELYLPIKDAEQLIFEIPEYYDEPFADSSQIPTMLVSRLTKSKVTVALSGDAGDELFCGYTRYDVALKYLKYKLISKPINSISNLINLPFILDKINYKLIKLLYLNNNNNIINFAYLVSKFYIDHLIKNHNFNFNKKYFDNAAYSNNIQEAYMIQDLIMYLPDDILTKVDRASMSASLEARTPLLDYRIIEYSLSIPHNLKYSNQITKYLLKKLTYCYIPEKIMNRPKMGFGIPILNWLHNDLNYLIEKYMNFNFIKRQNIFEYEKIKYLILRFNKEEKNVYVNGVIWNILIFQMWYDKYINGV